MEEYSTNEETTEGSCIKVCHLINYLDELDDILILRTDAFKNDEINDLKQNCYLQVYYGRVMNIPEYLKDYYLITNEKPLSLNMDNSNYPYFILKVKKSK